MRILILCVVLTGCAQPEPAPVDYGVDPYTIECINGETWMVSEHGRVNLGDVCNEG
jgi:hypothetical protein